MKTNFVIVLQAESEGDETPDKFEIQSRIVEVLRAHFGKVACTIDAFDGSVTPRVDEWPYDSDREYLENVNRRATTSFCIALESFAVHPEVKD